VIEPGIGDLAGIVMMLAADRREIDELIADVLPRLTPSRAIWTGYPKGRRSDLNRDSMWARVKEAGWSVKGSSPLSDAGSSVRLKRLT